MAAYDAAKNFAYTTVLTAPSPATSGTSLVVQSGQGALFPAAPFNATIWPAGTQPITTNAEIVRVTNISTDTFTITRTQESTSARTIVVGDQIAATFTLKTLTDIETAAPAVLSTWTPTYSNFTLGNGTLNTASYQANGKWIMGHISVTLGTTSSVSGLITFSLPITANTNYTATVDAIGEGFLRQTGTALWKGTCLFASTTTASMNRVVNNGGNIDIEATASNQPFTWGATHVFGCYFMYEAA